MGTFEAFVYGTLQGLTEYLPVSSSAHLILLPKFFGDEDPGLTFDVFLHLGTLVATLAYFWKDWLEIFSTLPLVGGFFPKAAAGDPASRLPSWKLLVYGTIPALIFGALLHKWAETTFRSGLMMALTMSVGGILLYLSDKFGPQLRTMAALKGKDAWLVGAAQCLALMPGFSRSGSTITAGRFLGFDRAASARFSFLLSAPVTFAAAVFECRHYHELLENRIPVFSLLVAGLCSFVFGWLAIDALLKLLRRHGYLGFMIYRLALAGLIFKLLGGG